MDRVYTQPIMSVHHSMHMHTESLYRKRHQTRRTVAYILPFFGKISYEAESENFRQILPGGESRVLFVLHDGDDGQWLDEAIVTI